MLPLLVGTAFFAGVLVGAVIVYLVHAAARNG